MRQLDWRFRRPPPIETPWIQTREAYLLPLGDHADGFPRHHNRDFLDGETAIVDDQGDRVECLKVAARSRIATGSGPILQAVDLPFLVAGQADQQYSGEPYTPCAPRFSPAPQKQRKRRSVVW